MTVLQTALLTIAICAVAIASLPRVLPESAAVAIAGWLLPKSGVFVFNANVQQHEDGTATILGKATPPAQEDGK